MINNKKIIEKYYKKMETINKIEDEFTKSQNKMKLMIDVMTSFPVLIIMIIMKKMIKNVKKKLKIKKQ